MATRPYTTAIECWGWPCLTWAARCAEGGDSYQRERSFCRGQMIQLRVKAFMWLSWTSEQCIKAKKWLMTTSS